VSDPTSRYPEQPRQPDETQPLQQPPAYVPPPGYEEYAPRQEAPHAGQPQPPYQQPYQPYQQPYQQGGYQQPYQGAPQRPTSVVAVIGLVLAFLLSPVGVVVSAFGIGDTRGGRKAGRGLAVAGVVVGVLGTVLWIAGIFAAVVFVRSAAQTVTDVASSIESLPAPSDLPSGLPSDLPSGLPTDLGDALGGEDGSADVVVDSCQSVIGGAATGEVTITNSTADPASYVVNVDALDASGQKVGELYAVQDAVDPGQSAQVQLFGYADDGADIASCEVFQALRTAG
jgi:hypothetical protein